MTIQELGGRSVRYRLRVEDYELLDRSGALNDFVRTELVEGEIIGVNAEYARHLRVKSTLFRRLADACDAADGGWSAWVDGSVALNSESAPQPDILITRGLPDDGMVPADLVLLLVEVSDSTVAFDLGTKAHLYARAAVPEYWVVDVTARVIHQLWSPAGETYGERREIGFGEPVTAATIAGLVAATDAL